MEAIGIIFGLIAGGVILAVLVVVGGAVLIAVGIFLPLLGIPLGLVLAYILGEINLWLGVIVGMAMIIGSVGILQPWQHYWEERGTPRARPFREYL
jgi:hypothetical protein